MSYSNAQTVTPVSSYYWIIYGNDQPAKNFKLHQVIDDSFSYEIEETTLNLINRGRRREFGTDFGYHGTIDLQLRDLPDQSLSASDQRLLIENIRKDKVPVYLRNPFGDIWLVAVDEIGLKRIGGVGLQEAVDVTIPYSEVSE